MGFFDEVPAPEPDPEPSRTHHPWDLPEAEFPGVVAIDTVQLGRTEQAAVAVTGISAFSAGFEIFLTARIRPGARGGPGDARDPHAARQSFRFGLALSDGRKAIGRYGGQRNGHDREPAEPILRPFAFGGSPRSQISRWWAWPLPPGGPLGFVCEWPIFGIAETRAGIDAQLILDAARRSVRLWPDDEG